MYLTEIVQILVYQTHVIKFGKRIHYMNHTRITRSILFFFFCATIGICQTPNSISVHGTLVDAENGDPIADVLVRVAPEEIGRVYPDREFAHATATDAKGTFSLTIPNEPQNYYAFSLMALHPQYQAKLLRQEMPPKKSGYDLGEIVLRRTLFLQGNVSGAKNAERVVINLKMHNKSADFFRAAAPIEHAAKTDTAGNFHFADLYPIEYTLTASRDSVIIAYVASINPQKQTQISVRVPKLDTLRGSVVDEQERPIAGAQIYATRHSEMPEGHSAIFAATQTDDAGNFQMQVLETESRFLSLEVRKSGYFSRIYENVDVGKMPSVIPLEKGITLKGRVILPRDVPSDAQYTVKVFPAYTQMESSLNPLVLHKPLLSKSFPVTMSTFIVDGLFAEEYRFYIVGDGISATGIDVNASADPEELLMIAESPVKVLEGRVLWADTGKPVHNAVVSRSWYPWELHPSDMSMTLDRFEAETDAAGRFKFDNLTEARYQLYIRAVHTAFEDTTERSQRTLVHKQIEIPACGTGYRIYLGSRDGTPFAK